MQNILYDTTNNTVVDMMELYSIFSEKNIEHHSLTPCMKPLIDELSKGTDTSELSFDKLTEVPLFDSITAQNHPNCCIVCFSGGKDSVATALECRKRGYDVKLYHVHGINHSYPDEVDRAVEIADYIKMPLYVENVKLSGKSDHQENPVKNQLICTMALDWSDKNGFGHRVAFGDFTNDHDDKSIYGTNWTDTVEMWEAYKAYISNAHDDFELIMPFENYLQTLTIISRDMQLLNMVQGCIAPLRYKKYWHNQNNEKYGNVLLPNRCGSCWKCCREYIFLVDNSIIQKNDLYYDKCLKILEKKIKEI